MGRNKRRPHRDVLLALLVLAASLAPLTAYSASGDTRENAPPPIVILVSIDGFGADYLARYRPPALEKLAREGVHVQRLIPSFPTLTFPNHYTLVTGLRPATHGIIANEFFDPAWNAIFRTGAHPAGRDARWWGGEPIWNTAERQGLIAACNFWPGSEAPIDGRRPTIWKTFDPNAAAGPRVAEVLSWLERPAGERPSFIAFYFREVDVAGHRFGPDDPATGEAVLAIDRALGELVAGIAARGLADAANLVVVSDHGMAAGSRERVIVLDDYIAVDDVQVDFSSELVGLRPHGEATPRELRDRLRGRHPHLRAYLAEDLPRRLHFRGHRRIPPVVLLADEGWRIVTREKFATWANESLKGAHGYDPELPSMSAILVAHGPAFRRGVKIRRAENLDVYHLLCAALRIAPAKNEGDRSLARAALRSR